MTTARADPGRDRSSDTLNGSGAEWPTCAFLLLSASAELALVDATPGHPADRVVAGRNSRPAGSAPTPKLTPTTNPKAKDHNS